MAESPSHRLGQIIGDLVEASIEPLLRKFAAEQDLYLDMKGDRPARAGKKCTWIDVYGNAHDLDYVFERGGTPNHIGLPVAFIETAWRRYTKHSRNKAQEIQGAILPLVATHENVAPFTGAILAGVFTAGALTQLKSRGFKVLYFQYGTVMDAFARFGIDAQFDEDTPDTAVSRKVRAWTRVSAKRKADVARTLLDLNDNDVTEFMTALALAVLRKVKRVLILPLHGHVTECSTVEDALRFVDSYRADSKRERTSIARYEIEIVYSNGDRIAGRFADRDSAMTFLRGYEPPPIHAATE